MRVYGKILDIDREAVQINLADHYREDAPVVQDCLIWDKNKDVWIKDESIRTSGLHIVESFLKTERDLVAEWKVEGAHVRFFFFFQGESSVDNGAGDESYEHAIGMLQRNFLGNTGSGGTTSIKAGTNIHQMVIRMSLDFYIELLKNEGWVTDDPFHQYVSSGIPENRPNETFYVNHKMLSVLQDIIRNTDMQEHRFSYICMKLRELFLLLHIHGVQRKPTLDTEQLDNEILDRVHSYLLLNLDRPPTIEQLSKKFLLNEKKLKAAFKTVYGNTIYAFVIKLRMEKANKLLLQNYNVNELSTILGYQSVSHFIKVFKNYHGYTPKEALKRINSITAGAIRGLKIGIGSCVFAELLIEYGFLFLDGKML